jgi:hypothetical protein
MKRAIAAIALVVVANGIVLVSAGRERAAPATLTTVAVCARHLIGGGTSDEAPALRLWLAPESLSTPVGLDAPGLRALGFTETVVAAVGRERDSTFRSPRARPAWVRLRQQGDSLEEWIVLEVRPLREVPARDSLSIVLRGLVAFRERPGGPPPTPVPGHDHAAMLRARATGMIYPAVTELIPSRLHLDHRQIAMLRSGIASTAAGCEGRGRALVATGASGGIWVESVR